MFGEGFFGSSTKIVETSGAEMMDCGLDHVGKVVIFRKQVFTSLSHMTSLQIQCLWHMERIWGVVDESEWRRLHGGDSHSYRGFDSIGDHAGQSGWAGVVGKGGSGGRREETAEQ